MIFCIAINESDLEFYEVGFFFYINGAFFYLKNGDDYMYLCKIKPKIKPFIQKK